MTLGTLLSSKLSIPAARPNLVPRPRLVAQLSEGLRLGHRLTLASAPPGFGKTTLIREWVGELERPVAWLSLDEADNDGTQFQSYVVVALNRADDRLALSPRDATATSSPLELLVTLINRLTDVGTDLVLVFDDYHAIVDFAVHDLVTFLLENQPPSLHVVIATREDPPLPLARLRARDQVTEIRERALRFTPEEASAFLNQTMKLGLAPEPIASLTARTEGWVTGLQLAALAIGQQSSVAEFAAAFAGDDRYIVDYLMSEVLDRTPDSLRGFLRQTSILDRLSAPLCAALTGCPDSQALLEHLDAANLFVIPLDNRREWYRYHVLFADALRLTLSKQERIGLHRKAAGWFEASGFGELAHLHTRLAAELSAITSAPGGIGAGLRLIEPLSEREIEVLHLIAEGHSNAEVARKLVIAIGTVKRHLNNTYGKLGVQSRTQALARAREVGLL